MTASKTAAVSVIALCLGLAAGRLLLPAPQQPEPVQTIAAANPADTEADAALEAAIIQTATVETALATLQTELTEARAAQAMLEAQVRELSAKSRRYEFIREQLLKEHPTSALSRLQVSDTTLELSDSLAEFLELSPSQTERINALGANMLQRTTNWEKANHTITEQSDDSYTIELPAYGGNMQEDYREQLANILAAEDAAVVDSMAKKFFENLGSKRQLQISIKEGAAGNLQLHQRLSVLYENGNTRSSSGTGYTIGGNGFSPTPEMNRWSHLYRIADDNE